MQRIFYTAYFIQYKVSGPDCIGKNGLRMALNGVADILTLSFLPFIWKLANVTSIRKSGSRSCAENYRPVSLTCTCFKMLEHIIVSDSSDKINDLLVPYQHAFTKGLLCTTLWALLKSCFHAIPE